MHAKYDRYSTIFRKLYPIYLNLHREVDATQFHWGSKKLSARKDFKKKFPSFQKKF